MKRVLLFFILISFSAVSFSQDLTGIWRGNFYAGVGPFQQYYKYEIQINQLKNFSLQGVTYSYRTTVFYGKATFKGIWFPKAKNAIVKELKLVELKMAGNSEACAMTCNLDYSKENGKEILHGSFTSVNANSKTDCGGGTVYLEKVPESDFHKEDFLLKKKPDVSPSAPNNPPTALLNDVSKTNTKKLQSALGIPADGIAGPKTIATLKKKLPDFNNKLDVTDTDQVNDLISRIKKANASAPKAPPVSNNDISKINAKKLQTALGIPADGVAGPKTIAALKDKLPDFNDKLDVTNTNQVNDLVSRIKKVNATAAKSNAKPPAQKAQPPAVIKQDTIAKTSPLISQDEVNKTKEKPSAPVPDVIKTRSNPLIKTIVTNLPDIKVELYDNGDIDGDTITVYHNNEVIALKKGLTDKPITLNVKADAANTTHEFVMVADNLGSIPPNTALMIITTGGKRYQLFIASDKQKNAKVIVQYQP